MSFDPLSALASFGPSIIGTKQLGAPAPMPQFGGGGMLETGFDPLEAQSPELAAMMQQYFAASQQEDPVGAAVASLPPPVDTPEIRANDVAGLPDLQGMAQQEGQQIGIPGIVEGEEGSPGIFDMFKSFGGNLDENLQSPSKLLGLGLLGQLSPKYGGAAGLGLMGLLGPNKIFGG